MNTQELITSLWAKAQESTGANAMGGTILQLFPDCTITFHAGTKIDEETKMTVHKQPGYWVKQEGSNKRLWIGLSRSLMPEYIEGKLEAESILKLPLYYNTDLKDKETGEILKDENGEKQFRITAGAPQAEGKKVSDINEAKVKEYKRASEVSFDHLIG